MLSQACTDLHQLSTYSIRCEPAANRTCKFSLQLIIGTACLPVLACAQHDELLASLSVSAGLLCVLDDRFGLHHLPMSLDYDEFEKLLLGIATLQARLRKRNEVHEQLGELLDTVYQKSSVLLTLPQA